MQISLSLPVIGILVAPVAGFVPASFASQKKMLKESASADPQTVPLQKHLNDTWVIEHFNEGPAVWLPEESSGSSDSKVFDWFGTASKTFTPDDSLSGMQVSGSKPPQDVSDCDWFASSIPDSTPVSTLSSKSVDDGSSDWFTQAITSSQFPHNEGSAADWFQDAMKSGNIEQPKSAPLFRFGPSSSFGQAKSAKVPFKDIEAPCLKSGVSEWFSQAIDEDVKTPKPSNPSTEGPNEWFSQGISPSKPESTRTSKGLPPGPSEWFAAESPSLASTSRMTPHEWFSVQEVSEFNPDSSNMETGISKEPPHEWFTSALKNRM